MDTISITVRTGSHDFIAIVDSADAHLVLPHAWRASVSNGGVYAMTCMNGTTVYMHRLITGAGKGEYVDHLNHSTLDNRRANLRIVGNSENQVNRSKLRSDNTSGLVGVYKVGRYWYGNVWHNGKKLTQSGRFLLPEDAARARDRVVFSLFGEHAYFNFPGEVVT